jgi:hypothetical protein
MLLQFRMHERVFVCLALCSYVYMHACICLHSLSWLQRTLIHVHAYVYRYLHTYVHIDIYTGHRIIHTYNMQTYIHACMHIIHTDHKYIHSYIYIYIHTCIPTYTQIIGSCIHITCKHTYMHAYHT